MDSTNLFGYATSELSQDAFICWLMSFALKENHEKNPALTSCALDILHRIPGLEICSELSSVERQNNNIDVLLRAGDFYVIIEDKTSAGTYEGQIPGYKKKLTDIYNAAPEKIICVLYKTFEQSQPEQNVDYEFTRKKLLQIMRPYKSKCSSDIFSDYVDYLEHLEDISLMFRTAPIDEWSGLTYQGFFTHLRDERIVPRNSDWSYVPNPSGGFWGLWWDFRNDIDPSGTHFDSAYLQIENDIIAVKIAADPPEDYDSDKLRNARQKIYDYFASHIEGFTKRKWRPGRYMTVGYIEYDEKNYKEQISKMQKVFDDMQKELRLE